MLFLCKMFNIKYINALILKLDEKKLFYINLLVKLFAFLLFQAGS